MNHRQKLIQQKYLNNEEAVLKRLKQVYGQSSKDINEKIKNLQLNIDGLQQTYDWMDDDDPEKAKIKSQIQSKIYQKKYQEQLQSQVDGILKQMQTKQYLTISEYLDDCYTDGFIGTVFDMHGQGVPVMMPIDQESMVRAVQLESKISKGLYTKLGEDVDLLKKKITAQISRSISTGMSYAQTAQQLANYTNIGYNKAARIARTEGHRIQTTATMDACHKAKDKGANVVKQWDATLDARTRDSHAQVDGEIRELDEHFSNGLMFPGDPSGSAAEVVNCRCALLQRARWALDRTELETLEERAAYFGLDKTEQFDNFKKNYLKAVDEPKPTPDSEFIPAKTIEEAEEFIKKYIDDSHWAGTGVSYAGVSVETANMVNATLVKLFETFDFDKLGGVYVAKGNTKLGKLLDGATAAYAPLRKSLLLNNRSLKNVDDIVKNHAKELKLVQDFIDDPTSFTFKTQRAADTMKASIISGRATVPGTVEEVIYHEMGHALEKKVMQSPDWVKAKANMSTFAEKVSGYATINEGEYIAESFTSYLKGEDFADPELVKIFKGLMR